MQSSTKLDNLVSGVAGRESPIGPAATARGVRSIWHVIRGVSVQAARGLRATMDDLRRRGARPKRLRVVESLALGGKRQLLLVTCDEQEYLVGTGAESVETILLRQPVATPVACDEAGELPSATAPRSANGKNDVTSAPRRMASTHLRHATDWSLATSGLRLVTQHHHGAPEDEIPEAGNGKGRELWR